MIKLLAHDQISIFLLLEKLLQKVKEYYECCHYLLQMIMHLDKCV